MNPEQLPQRPRVMVDTLVRPDWSAPINESFRPSELPSFPDAETLARPEHEATPARLEFLLPENDEQRDTFMRLLRSDAAIAEATGENGLQEGEQRLVSKKTAYNALLDQLNSAKAILAAQEAMIQNPEAPKVKISESKLADVYFKGADAYAGMLTLAQGEIPDDAMAEFSRWTRMATRYERWATAVKRPREYIALTPTELSDNSVEIDSVRENLEKMNQANRLEGYVNAAETGNPSEIAQAFVGENTTRLERAQALFDYSITLENNNDTLKSQCLEHSIGELKKAVNGDERPRNEQVTDVYYYFKLQATLARAVHDLAMLDGEGTTEEYRARKMAEDYMLNACDAFAFVRQQAVESPRGKEKALEARIKEFDTEVHSSKAINDAQDTVQWLSGSLSELRNAEADLLDTENKPIVPEPGESPESVAEKEQLKEEDVADKTENVEALSVKAQEEQLETKIAEELEKISVAFAEILSRYEDIMDSLLAKRLDHIGSIRVGTKGRETARMLVELQNALDEARHFGWVYSNENKQIRWQGQADRAVEDAKAELAAAANARAATKGRRALTLIKSMSDLPGPEDPRLSGKTFVQPTSELFQAA